MSKSSPSWPAQRLLLWFVLLMAGLCSQVSHAHTRSVSYSFWSFHLPETSRQQSLPKAEPASLRADVRVRLPLLALTRLELHPELSPDFLAAVSRYAQKSLYITSKSNGLCSAAAAKARQNNDGWVDVAWQVECPAVSDPSGWEIRSELFASVAASHLHFARQLQPLPDTRILTAKNPAWSFSVTDNPEMSAGGRWQQFSRYSYEGVVHILAGWDHLAFVVGLLLIVGRWRQLLISLTGFTVGHSITLVLATLGVISINVVAVEAVIALTIAIVALEFFWRASDWRPVIPIAGMMLLLGCLLFPGNIPRLGLIGLFLFTISYWWLSFSKRQQSPSTWWLSTGFGLLHGLGFASVLSELELPSAQLGVALLGFNLGVELGQCLVVAMAWPALQSLRRRYPNSATLVSLAIATALLALAAQWFVLRSYLS